MHKAKGTRYGTILLVLVVACGKKDDTKSTATPPPKPGGGAQSTTPPLPATCGPGELHDGDKCVEVATATQVEAVRGQAAELARIEAALDKVEVIVGPVQALNALRELDTWKAAVKARKELAAVDATIEVLEASVVELSKLRSIIGSSRSSLDAIALLLSGVIDGKSTVATLKDAKQQISTEVKKAVEPLQAHIKVVIDKAIGPAKAELAKIMVLRNLACAPADLGRGSDDLKNICKAGRQAIETAIEFVGRVEKMPPTMLTDLLATLNAELDGVIDDEVTKLLGTKPAPK